MDLHWPVLPRRRIGSDGAAIVLPPLNFEEGQIAVGCSPDLDNLFRHIALHSWYSRICIAAEVCKRRAWRRSPLTGSLRSPHCYFGVSTRAICTNVLRGKPNTVTSGIGSSKPPPDPELAAKKRHCATSSRPGKRAKCSAWANALGWPGDCVRPDVTQMGHGVHKSTAGSQKISSAAESGCACTIQIACPAGEAA